MTLEGNQAHTSQGALPVQARRTRTVTPAASYSNTSEALSTGEAHVGGEGQGFYQSQGTLSLAHTKVPDSQRKARAQQDKPHHSYKQLKSREPLLSVREPRGPSGGPVMGQSRKQFTARYSFCTRDRDLPRPFFAVSLFLFYISLRTRRIPRTPLGAVPLRVPSKYREKM